MRVILDNNIWISFLIGKQLRLLAEVFTRTDISVYVCDELIREFKDVARRPKISRYVSNDDIASTLHLMEALCTYVKIDVKSTSPVRDVNDLYLLSLADSVKADYIVTGDEDLLVLRKHNSTSIVTYRYFQSLLPSSPGNG